MAGIDLSKPLSFDSLLPSFEDQYAASEARRKEELEQIAQDAAILDKKTRDSAEVAARSRASAAVSRETQLDVLGGISKELEKGARAIQLSESDNPMDRLSLWMLQQSDSSYTREGNLNRINYYQQAAAAVNGVEAVRQTGYQDELNAIESAAQIDMLEGDVDLTMLKALETQGAERLDAAAAYLANMNKMLTDQQQMRLAVISEMPEESINSAIEQAQKTDSKTANVKGQDISLAMLQQQKDANEQRKYTAMLRDSQTIDLTLANMTPDDINDAVNKASTNNIRTSNPNEQPGSVSIGGVNVPLARLLERQAALTNQSFVKAQQEYSMTQFDRARDQDLQRRELQTMNSHQLGILQANGGVSDSGRTYDLGIISETYGVVKTMEADQIALQIAEGTGQLDPIGAVRHKQALAGLDTSKDPELAKVVADQTQAANFASGLFAEAGDNPNSKVVAAEILRANQESLNKAIGASALKQAAGDKDLAYIIESKIRGVAPDPAIVQTMLEGRLKAEKPLLGFLEPEIAAQATQAYFAAYSEAGMMSATGLSGPADKAQKEAYATQAAMEVIKFNARGYMTEALLGQASQVGSHPIAAAGINPSGLLSMIHSVESDLRPELEEEGLSAEQIANIFSGRESHPGFEQKRNARFLMELERTKPGLAKAYADWWSGQAVDVFIPRFIASREAQNRTPEALAQWSLVKGDVMPAAKEYGIQMNDAMRIVYDQEIRTQHDKFVQFRGNQRSKQAFLLEQTPGLSDHEKQIGMTLLTPILKEAAAQELNDADTTGFVEGRLRQLDLKSNPEGAGVLKKIIAGRTAALKITEDFIKANTEGRAGRNLKLFGFTDKQIGFSWLAQMDGGI